MNGSYPIDRINGSIYILTMIFTSIPIINPYKTSMINNPLIAEVDDEDDEQYYSDVSLIVDLNSSLLSYQMKVV